MRKRVWRSDDLVRRRFRQLRPKPFPQLISLLHVANAHVLRGTFPLLYIPVGLCEGDFQLLLSNWDTADPCLREVIFLRPMLGNQRLEQKCVKNNCEIVEAKAEPLSTVRIQVTIGVQRKDGRHVRTKPLIG
jgi:hypothetical protein